VAGSFENGNEPSGSVKDREFLYQLSDCQLHNEGSATQSAC